MRLLEEKKQLFLIFLSTLFFMILAYIFCYTNLNISHDSVSQFNLYSYYSFFISIGRYLAPLFIFIRGVLSSPIILFVFVCLNFTLSTYFLCKIFNLKNKIYILLLSGILVCSYPIIYLSNYCISLVDVYSLSFFLSIFSAYLWNKYKRGWLLSILFLFIALGIYQAYVSAFFSLVMIISILSLFNEEKDLKVIINKIIKAFLSIFIAAVIYFIGYKLSLYIFNIGPADDYNALGAIFKFDSISNLASLFVNTYISYFKALINMPTYFIHIVNIINFFIIIFIVYSIIKLLKTSNIFKTRKLLIIFIILLFPLACNYTFIFSNGIYPMHMHLSNFLIYVYFIIFFHKVVFKKQYQKIIIFSYILILFSSIIYSNQLSAKVDIEFKTTISTMNRIIYRIENTDGYVFNETPVVFCGYLLFGPLDRTNKLYSYGIDQVFVVSYNETYNAFINGYLGYPMKVVYGNWYINKYNIDYINNMPSFPHKDSIQYVDGVIIVKLSDEYIGDFHYGYDKDE